MRKAVITKRTAAFALGGAMSLSCLAGAVTTAFVADGRKIALAAGNIVNVDASMQYQTFDGWGTSLAWWANECGDWTRESANGKTQRQYIMDLLFGEEGLNWNIARYNVGGGENPTHSHLSYDTDMPGFQPNGRGTAYDWENGDGTTKSWEETVDYRQLWVLDAFQKIRNDIATKNGTESDAVTEFFSNSPPYWMLGNQCASGAGKNANLKDDYINDYVNYFMAVYKYLIDQGFSIDYLQPFNESSIYAVGWGVAEGNKGSQEGCAVSPEQKVKILQGIQTKINELVAIDAKYDVGYNFGDEVDTGRAVSELDAVGNITGGKAVIEGADKLTYHIYGWSIERAQEVYRRAKANGQKAEMSEITWKDGIVYDPSAMDTALNKYSDTIIKMIKYGGAEAYVYWQGMENLTGLIKAGWNYGVLGGVYDNPAMPSTVSGIDLASRGLVYQDVKTCKSYYVGGQYSKYIKAGYHIVDVSDDASLAAISPDGTKLIIVKENNGSGGKDLKFNLNNFGGNKVTKIYTDPTHDWAKEVLVTSEEGQSFNSFEDTVTPYSVTTYVVEGVSKAGSAHIVDESARIQKTDVAAIQSAITEKEALFVAGTWGDGGQNDKESFAGKTIYNSGTVGTHYVAVRFYGTGIGVLGERKSDSAVLQYWYDPVVSGGALPATADGEVDTRNSTRLCKQQILRVNDLTEGWHTVYIKVKSGYLNLDGVFVINGADSITAVNKPVVTNLFGSNKTLYVNFNVVEGATEYQVEYRKKGTTEWTAADVSVGSGKIANENFVEGAYEVRVKTTIGDAPVYSDICNVKMNVSPEGLLYYVDCGTNNFSDGGWGRAYGSCQSIFDKNYGADPVTGVKWGIDTAASKFSTGWQAEDPFSSIVYGGNTDNKITYKFTIPKAGEYVLTVGGFRPQGWGSRTYTITIDGTSGLAAPEKKLVAEDSESSIVAIPFKTTTANKEITVTIPQPDGLSLLAITEKDNPIPIYAKAKSNYTMTGTYDHSGVTENGDKYLGEELGENVELNVVMSDGTEKTFATSDGGLTIVSKELTDMKANEYYTAGYVVGGANWKESWPAMTAYATYLLKVQKSITQEYKVLSPEQLFFYIDAGSDGYYNNADKTFNGGTARRQGDNAPDQKYDGTNAWGFVDSRTGFNGCNWKNDVATSSIREFDNGGGYVMTGFQANQAFTLAIGMNCHNWGKRTIEIRLGGTVSGNTITGGTLIDTVEAPNDGNKDFTYQVNADAEGKLIVSFTSTTKDSKDVTQNTQISYIKAYIPAVIQEEISGGLPALPAIKVGQTAYFRQSFEEGVKPAIELKGLEVGAMVYVMDSKDRLVDCFKATETSCSWNKWDKVAKDAYALRFTQAKKEENISSASGSDETIVALPWLDLSVEDKIVKMGEKIGIIAKTTLGNLPKDAFGTIDSLKVTRPDGETANIIGSFFYRTLMNGEHTVTMVCNGVSYSTKIMVGGIEMPDVLAEYTPDSKSFDEITIKFTPRVSGISADTEIDGVKAGIAELYVKTFTPEDENHPAKAEDYTFVAADKVDLASGSCSVTATENGYTYLVKVVSNFGSERTFIYKIEDQIDRSELTGVKINVNYGTASGVRFTFAADQNGKLVYTVNGGEEVRVDNIGSFTVTKSGKYVLQFLSYNNRRSQAYTYYVTDGTQANLADVSVGADGNVSINGANVTAKLYLAGQNTPLSNLSVANAGKYYLELTKDGEKEIVVLNTAKTSTVDNVQVVQPTAPKAPAKSGASTDLILTIVFASLAAAAVAGATVIGIKRRKV